MKSRSSTMGKYNTKKTVCHDCLAIGNLEKKWKRGMKAGGIIINELIIHFEDKRTLSVETVLFPFTQNKVKAQKSCLNLHWRS